MFKVDWSSWLAGSSPYKLTNAAQHVIAVDGSGQPISVQPFQVFPKPTQRFDLSIDLSDLLADGLQNIIAGRLAAVTVAKKTPDLIETEPDRSGTSNESQTGDILRIVEPPSLF